MTRWRMTQSAANRSFRRGSSLDQQGKYREFRIFGAISAIHLG
jgi:hypothetical protein